MSELDRIKERILALDKTHRIKFISFYGSRNEGKYHNNSDYDLAVYYQGTAEERFRFRMKALGELGEKIDLQIFQDLPLPVQKEILGGKVIYYKNFKFVFDIFMKIIKEFNFFEKYLDEYYLMLEGGKVGV